MIVIYKCCCKKGTLVSDKRYNLFPTDVDSEGVCIYCGYTAFADNDANSSGSVVHMKYKSDKKVRKELDGDGYGKFECNEGDRRGICGSRNGKAILTGDW